MTMENAIRNALADLKAIEANLSRALDTLHGCQPGPSRPDQPWLGPDTGIERDRDRADNPNGPQLDMRRLTHAARAVQANAAVIRDVVERYPGRVVATPAKRGQKIGLPDDWDGCVDCAQDTRHGRPHWTPIDPRRPDARLCDWCAKTRAKYDTDRVPVELVCLHHDGRRISETLAVTSVMRTAKARPKAGSYTERATLEAQAMTEAGA